MRESSHFPFFDLQRHTLAKNAKVRLKRIVGRNKECDLGQREDSIISMHNSSRKLICRAPSYIMGSRFEAIAF